MRRSLKIGALAVSLAVGGTLLVPTAAHAHGYVGADDRDPSGGTLTARAAIRANGDIGGITYEPQSLEARKGYPAAGPADGQLASAGHPLARALDVQTEDRWVKNDIQTGELTLGWELKQSHRTSEWRYYMTKVGWDPNDKLERSDFELIDTVEHDGSHASNNTVHTITVPDDREGYHVIYAVWDVADTGNAFYNVIDVDVTARDEGHEDTTPPSKVGDPRGEAASPTSARLTWKAATDDTAIAKYRIWSGHAEDYVQDVPASTTSAEVTGLRPGTVNPLGVEAVDAAGNPSGFTVLMVRTPAASEKPAAPKNLHSMGTTDTSVDLMWSPGDDATDVRYEVLRDGQRVGVTTQTRFSDADLTASTWYRYEIAAVVGEHRSERSEPLMVATATNTSRPFSLISPTPGSEHRNETVAFTGRGTPGHLVRLAVTNFDASDITTTVDEDGRWELRRYLGNGDYTFDLTHEHDGRVAHVIHSLRLNADAAIAKPFTLTSPTSGDEIKNRMVTFSGTGTPGQEVFLDVTNFESSRVSTVVRPDGTWTVDRYIGSGAYAFDISQQDATGAQTGLVRNVRLNAPEVSPDKPFAVTSPSDRDTFLPNQQLTFSGTGRVGATVTLDPGAGLQTVTTIVRDDATWQVQRYMGDGSYTFAVSATRDGVTDTVDPIHLTPRAEPPGGPKPASIAHAAESSQVLLHGLGSASAERDREGRWFRHSDLQPTGRFVRAGDDVTVTLPAGAPRTAVRIGLIGPHTGINGGKDVAVGTRVETPSGTSTKVTADRDGMVYLVSTASSGSATATVAGGDPVPTFVRGETTNSDFAKQLRDYAKAPMTTIVGERIFGDFQATTRSAFPTDMSARVAEWDRVVERTNDVYGLSDDATGASRKAPHRIHIVSPDTGAGYANASNDRIMFQVGTGAAADLFSKPVSGLWGFWHEIGHTYEPPAYNWSGQTEVAVNIAPLHIQTASGWQNRLDSEQTAINAFFAKPVTSRNYASETSPWLKVLMYDQLRRAFGEEFYPQLNRELRVSLAVDGETTSSDSQKRDLFARVASRVADRDLTPFFTQWGIPIGAAAKSEMAERPALTSAIWENRHSSKTTVERTITAHGVPVGTPDKITEPVLLGSSELPVTPTVRNLGVVGGTAEVKVGSHRLDARNPDSGRVYIELRSAEAGREVLSAPVPVTLGTSFRFTGINDHEVMRLLLDPATNRIRVLATQTQWSHDSWGSKEYVGFELRSADDRTSMGNWSVRGNQSAVGLANGFDQSITEGQILVVRHQQAGTHLTRYADGAEQPRSGETIQRFRISDGELVRI